MCAVSIAFFVLLYCGESLYIILFINLCSLLYVLFVYSSKSPLIPCLFLVYSLTCTFPVYRYGVTETLLTVLSGHINGHIDTREHHRLVECLGTLTQYILKWFIEVRLQV